MTLQHNSAAILAVTFGSVLALVVSGHQIGRGNQTCYLLDGLRALDPWLLHRDWFMTQTLQYHAVFSRLIEGLLFLHALNPGLLIGYLLLILLWQTAWYGLSRALGLSDAAHVLSVVLYFLSSAGISLGVYQFMQDGCFLPSNISNVALLGSILFWILGRPILAGVCMGIGGAMHINYAIVGSALWVALLAWRYLDARRHGQSLMQFMTAPGIRLGTAVALIPSTINVLFTAVSILHKGLGLQLTEFVAVYVRFRHTHHFDPLAWHASIWVGFLWPIPLAIWAAIRASRSADPILIERRRQAVRIFLIISAMLVVAFFFAGVWYVDETLIQLCLFRFSIYVKLLSCVAVAYLAVDQKILSRKILLPILAALPPLVLIAWALIERRAHAGDAPPLIQTAADHNHALLLVAALVAVPFLWLMQPRHLSRAGSLQPIAFAALLISVAAIAPAVGALGLGMTPEPDDAQYRQICAWASDPANTPLDALFIVPPEETDFRLYAQRAIVVNFKHIPQLDSEVRQWRDRLADVLGTTDFSIFPRDYPQTLAAIGRCYEARPAADLVAVARKYDARYIVVAHPFDTSFPGRLVCHPAGNRYFVYDLGS